MNKIYRLISKILFGGMLILAGCASVATAEPTLVATMTATAQPTATLAPAALQEAVFEAAKTDNVEAMTNYIAAGANINEEFDYGLTVLEVAIARKNPEMALLLLDADASWTIETFHNAISLGNLEVVQAFLDKGADLNETSGPWGTHALLFAARHGHIEIGKLLIEHGADIYLGDSYGDPALNVAAWNGQLEFVEMLLDSGVNPTTPNYKGRTALYHSIWQKHTEVEKVLQAAGAE
jgi:ankyrin repeat protein